MQRRAGGLVAVDTGEPLDERAVDLRSAHCGPQTRWVRRCSDGFVLPGDDDAEQRLLELPDGESARVLVARPAPPCVPERAVSACRELLSAISVADVAAAWQGWVVPVNDVIAADRTGACLHTVAGSYLPAPYDDAAAPVGAFGSVGSLEPSGATHARGSRRSRGEHLDHVMVRANQRPADEHESAARLGCAPPHRARRATQLLEQAIAERGVVSHEDLLAAQVDTHLSTWPGLLAQLLGDRGPVAKTLRDWLLAWDGDMSADSEVAALFARWRDTFARELAASEVLTPLLASSRLPALWQPFLDPVARVGLALESIVVRGPSVGLDPQGAAVRTLDSVAAEHTEAMDTAGSRSVENQPSWGLLHAFAPHRAHPDLPPFTAVPVGGDTDCLLSAGTIPGWGPACARVPAARVLWDLADPAASWWITPDPVDRGSLGAAPVLRWAAGEMDHALPWVPAGGLEPTDAPGPRKVSDGLAAVGRPSCPWSVPPRM
ncbi:penicillin acylase family protein [Kocuria atrinae]|uniref:penicillin acylase family protein n=1 Tax=Kocuria atrinae TaxID=592377 RepID=UPI00031E60B6|nr:penicillin acylase family protein [Kocuria atrinae]